MSKNSVAGFQSISHAKKLPQYKKNDDFILSRSLSFPDYSWWCEKLQLQGVYSNSNPSGWWAGRMQSQSSFSQISLQWVCGRQRGRVGMTEAQAGSWRRLRYGLLCLGLLQVMTWNLIVKGKHVCSLVSSEWPASARRPELSYSLWLFQGCGGARAASGRWARQQEQPGLPVCSQRSQSAVEL